MAADARQVTAPAAVRSTTAVENLVRRYGTKRVLDDVSLAIEPGEFVALLGPSGCGKSTLLRALAGLDHDVAGSGSIGVPQDLAVVFQDSRLLPWDSVLGNVILGLAGRDAADRGRRALAEVGLSGREDAWPHELSGGQQQRAALARSLVRNPQLLLADEPFGALDALTRLKMHDLLRELWRSHRPSVLLVTHDVDEAIALADRVVVLNQGRIVLQRSIPPAGLREADPRTGAEIRAELLAAIGVVPAAAAGPTHPLHPGGATPPQPSSADPSRRPS